MSRKDAEIVREEWPTCRTSGCALGHGCARGAHARCPGWPMLDGEQTRMKWKRAEGTGDKV